MICPLYSYRDQLTGFGAILIEQNEQTAVRGFSYAVNTGKGLMGFSPKEYDLFKIGEFDMDKGILIPEKFPVLIVNGSSVFNEGEEE